jgi:hypothetical protein
VQQTNLTKSERVFILSFLAVVFTFVLIAKRTSFCSLALMSAEQADRVTVTIIGAVRQETSVNLSAGSRICDLQNHIDLADDADLRFFKRRKLLQNHDVVQVPRSRRLKH